jgi:hypothetical protein
VRRAPERDVLAEERVPGRVEREAGERDPAADEHHDGARAHAQADERQPPPRAPDRPPQRAVQQRGDDDPLQPGDDQQVRDREHAAVPAVVDVVADVPVHAQDGDLQRQAGEQHRRDVAGGKPGDALLVAEHPMCELHVDDAS